MLEQLVHRVETRLVELGRRLWRPDPQTQLREEFDAVAAELSTAQAALERARAEQQMRQRRADDGHARATALTGQIKAYLQRGQAELAWAHALELDRLRQLLTEDRAALPRLGQTCWSLEFRIRQIERRLTRLREKLG